MPRFEHLWRHVIINTHSSWLHGDARGFRTRKHRIHSTGDYKNPPPAGEHAGLYIYQDGKSRMEVHIGYGERAIIGRAFVAYLREKGYTVLAVAITKMHGHALVEVPRELARVKQIIGQAKRFSSRAVEKQMPGSVWSAGGQYKPVTDRDHCENTHDYIIFERARRPGRGLFAMLLWMECTSAVARKFSASQIRGGVPLGTLAELAPA
ncbi:MAG TPA: hypothetical protein VFE47_00905 [Tepidisphaeraceae bacterium]|jgi:REP element-mobilizing transposase RayT|nr:hypothetical protein [Tepidisphaeraceae bacterium]